MRQEGDPFQGSRLLFNTWKGIVRGDTRADEERDFIGKGGLGGEQEGKGAQENCSATWLTVSGFMVMGFPGCLWPIIQTQGPSWWHVHCSAKMDNSEKDSGRLVGHVDWHLLAPFDLSRILPVGGDLFCVPYQDLLSQGNSCKWFLWCLARVGGFSQWFPISHEPPKPGQWVGPMHFLIYCQSNSCTVVPHCFFSLHLPITHLCTGLQSSVSAGKTCDMLRTPPSTGPRGCLLLLFYKYKRPLNDGAYNIVVLIQNMYSSDYF